MTGLFRQLKALDFKALDFPSFSFRFMAFLVLFTFSAMTTYAGMSTEIANEGVMRPTQTIAENTRTSKDHSTLMMAMKAAGLLPTFKSPAPLTLFAPTNAAFDKLPYGTISALLKNKNLGTLKQLISYHAVAGEFDHASLLKQLRSGIKPLALKTIAGTTLWVTADGDQSLFLKDAQGNLARIASYDLYQSNGVIHVVDTVMMPNS